MKVTFDSNTFRKVIDLPTHKNKKDRAVYENILDAISDGKILPYFSSGMFIFEEVPKKKERNIFQREKLNLTILGVTVGTGEFTGNFNLPLIIRQLQRYQSTQPNASKKPFRWALQ